MATEESVYAVLVDNKGIAYLRVGITPKENALLVYNTGDKVELIEMSAATVRSRDLKPVPKADLLESARALLVPLSKVPVSKRATEQLEKIVNNQELIQMAKEKAATKPSAGTTAKMPKTKKTAAPKKNGNGEAKRIRVSANLDAVVKLEKGPTDESIKRHVDFLTALKEDGGGSMTLEALAKAFGKRVKSKQDPVKVFGMHRKALDRKSVV